MANTFHYEVKVRLAKELFDTYESKLVRVWSPLQERQEVSVLKPRRNHSHLRSKDVHGYSVEREDVFVVETTPDRNLFEKFLLRVKC